ncbi:MAG: hypothetical protein K2G88_01200, partial [Oscillospiraceae bacterium]|nr:hypothetical protein [Oscillospiraceae bacterium]
FAILSIFLIPWIVLSLLLFKFVDYTKTFLKKVGKKFKRIAEHFSKIKDSDQWKKTTTIHEELVDADDVPEEIRMKAARESEDTVDITHETEKELEMAYRS